MTEIITDLTKLKEGSQPLTFLSETGVDKEEGLEIIQQLKEAMAMDETVLALAAPQIGINKRIFCIRFNETIKTFINPIITKKGMYAIKPETFASMPGKEILITRPEELTVVYYTEDFKYEENKLLAEAARIFDQQCQLLDGITPADLGLVSDVATDGSLADLTDEEITQITNIYKQFIKAKTEAFDAMIKDNPDLASQYNNLSFTEKVINGKAAIVTKGKEEVSAEAKNVANLSIKQFNQHEKQANRIKLAGYLKNKRGR